MKKTLYSFVKLIVLQFVVFNVQGQTQLWAPNNGAVASNGTNTSVIVSSKLGVGNYAWTPQSTFQVYEQYSWPVSLGGFYGGDYSTTSWSSSYLGFNVARTSTGQLRTETDNSNNGGALLAAGINGGLRFLNIPTNAAANPQLLSTSSFNGFQTMYLTPDHKVVIGSYNLDFSSSNYKLFVQTGIITEKIKVALVPNWADFVFAKNYKLRPLSEVETFINENQHLPEIPSAEEVSKNGFDLGEMDAKLLQKVEELTLYMIEMKKEMEILKKKNQELEQLLSK